MELDDMLAVLRALDEQAVRYVLIGGAAVNLHGLVRNTEDIDIFIEPAADNVASLRRALASLWDDPSIEEITAEDLCGEYPAVRYYPPERDLYVDIATRFGDAVRWGDLAFEVIEIEGVPVRLATPATLYEMKRATVREIDRWDAARLAARFGLEDE